MTRIRWNRIGIAILIILTPLILGWIKNHIDFTEINNSPFNNIISIEDKDHKKIILLAIILTGITINTKIIKKEKKPHEENQE